MDIKKVCESLRKGSNKLALQTAAEKNLALEAVAVALDKNREKIFAANKADIEKGRASGMSESLIDRLMLNDSRLDGVIASLRTVIAQTDPIGEEVAGWKTPNGLTIRQVRVPLGVVSIIYESRPNVTVDAFCLAYKSGNAILLRGSSSAYNSNKAIVEIIKKALSENYADARGGATVGVPESIELVEVKEHDHSDVDLILNAVGLIDVVLPRGGKKLIQNVVSNARVPVIETGSGVCHLYVDKYADLDMAANVAENAKIQRPSVCNACECILIHKDVASDFIPKLAEKFNGRVKVHCDEKAFSLFQIVPQFDKNYLLKATEDDFGMEYLDYECCVKVVESIEESISYINSHNTKHSESIITENRGNARLFQQTIDASCVYVNSSTRFTDGGEFGFGAELGISTQKLHARGPMGIKALTTTKYLIDGEGQIR